MIEYLTELVNMKSLVLAKTNLLLQLALLSW